MAASRQAGMWLVCTGLVVMWLFAPSAEALAQGATEYQVKAAYLYNFAKFIDWPREEAHSDESPLRICVLEDKQFEETLREVINGKSAGSHSLSVMGVRVAGQARACQILFISSSHSKETMRVLEELRDTSIVTVGEVEGFVESGGIINFVLENERIHFQVNERAAENAGLHISSRLLNVAKLVVR